ncbi:hypothetical protein [Streptomyces sp. cg35]|uniref:hypothetical protein n=1 Tax=Streptomyces sp. cg35 TaxID=3421650 RepID=UPI003D174F38
MNAHDQSKWWESVDPIPVDEIAERLRMNRTTAGAWARKGKFGPVVEARGSAGEHLYDPRYVFLAGKVEKVLDDDGQVIRTVQRGGHHVYSDQQKYAADGMRLLSVPQVAELFAVEAATVNQWTKRRRTRGAPYDIPEEDLRESGFVYWREDTITQWGIDTRRLDPRTKKPSKRTGS